MICPNCTSQMAIRQGKNGQFLGCSSFPKCKHTQPMTHREEQHQDDLALAHTEMTFNRPHDKEARQRRIEYATADLEIMATEATGYARLVYLQAVAQRREMLK